MIFRIAAAFSSEIATSVNHYGLGGEVTFNQTLTARFGYQTGIDTRGFSAGLGIRYSFAKSIMRMFHFLYKSVILISCRLALFSNMDTVK
jgi:hypothetical protein